MCISHCVGKCNRCHLSKCAVIFPCEIRLIYMKEILGKYKNKTIFHIIIGVLPIYYSDWKKHIAMLNNNIIISV